MHVQAVSRHACSVLLAISTRWTRRTVDRPQLNGKSSASLRTCRCVRVRSMHAAILAYRSITTDVSALLQCTKLSLASEMGLYEIIALTRCLVIPFPIVKQIKYQFVSSMVYVVNEGIQWSGNDEARFWSGLYYLSNFTHDCQLLLIITNVWLCSDFLRRRSVLFRARPVRCCDQKVDCWYRLEKAHYTVTHQKNVADRERDTYYRGRPRL